jgi:hypothetical protein
MYILVIMLLSSTTYVPIDNMEFSSLKSCENAKLFFIKHQQLKYKNVFAECVQK